MSYDVHITRAENWAENEDNPISLDEWITYARSDPELRVEIVDGWSESKLPNGEVLRMRARGLVGWFGMTPDQSGTARAWFHYTDGDIHTRFPSVDTLRKMFRIAQALNAKVQGDDGEHHDANGDLIDAP